MVQDKNNEITLHVPTKANEHLLNILKAGLATVPFAGGLASLINDYIPSSKVERLENFTKGVAEDLEHFKDSIDQDRLLTEEYAFIFEQCFKGAAENYQVEKLGAFRAILLNSAGVNILPDHEAEYFISLVTILTPLHLKILKFMAMPEVYLSENKIDTSDIKGGFSSFFPIAIPNVDINIIKVAFSDLKDQGFLNTDSSIFNTMTSGQGLDLLHGRVTKLGEKFIHFCSLEH